MSHRTFDTWLLNTLEAFMGGHPFISCSLINRHRNPKTRSSTAVNQTGKLIPTADRRDKVVVHVVHRHTGGQPSPNP